ncbi:hypothetical protein MAPG_10695 [Magnaporthiopsis poae ATCC 64411]|uniref:Mediator of RNA polymerase II transcription subunit 19 n=1 Tax=Magnaporthiopsis poae (strain ATCC 64411 / 73-15) TaxID=644358 RepID=A0A0C4EDA1_MAGP6|nr:hypothetical protein MAPG_10695 [Magnaporthiopsis poae ATCC 64411]
MELLRGVIKEYDESVKKTSQFTAFAKKSDDSDDDDYDNADEDDEDLLDSVKKDVQDPDSFLALLWAPAEDWINTEVHGKDITAGLSSDVIQNLSRATTMARGPIPKRDWDSSVLGDLPSDKATAPNTPLNLPPMSRPKGGQQPPVGDANRPRRAGKKRSYGDSSFEGSGEAFADDQDVGYSTGEADERGGQKRRKKVLLAT